jgi:hypothetical protein
MARDGQGRVWVTTEQSGLLFDKALAVVHEFDSLDGADLFENEGFKELRKRVAGLRRLLEQIEGL